MNRLLCAVGLLLAGGSVRGDPPPGVKMIRVMLTPALPPAPALRYPLLPELRHTKPGNAVPFYRKAVMGVKEVNAALDDKQWYQRLESWDEMPLKELPRDQIRVFLREFEGPLREVDDAARHEYADWELTDKLRKMGISTLFSDFQELRQFANLLSVRTRLALAEGRLDDAIRDVQTIFAIARHLNDSPALITALIGLALSRIAAERVDEVIQLSTTPNLYWSLTDLPQPFIDLRLPFQGERLSAYGTFKGIPMSSREELKPLTPEQAEQMVKLFLGLQRDDLPIPDEAYKIHLALDMQRKHEKAKQALVEAGWPREGIEKLPHMQVAVMHAFLEYDRRLDEVIKWNSFPYWQAEPELLRLEKPRNRMKHLPGPNDPSLPIADIFLSAGGRIMYSRTRFERKIAALRCVEAIRLYAAKHDSKLPPSLDAIREVPIPVDPYTGKPFEYKASADRATLFGAAHAPPIPGRLPTLQEALAYEIVLKK